MSAASCKMTVTVKLATPTFPSLSVAVHVIVLVPIGRSVFASGEQPRAARDEFPTKFPILLHTGMELNDIQLCEDPSHKLTDEFIPE
mgnify:CR=1 FL=1